MTQEVYVDGIGNISVQGPVVTLTFVRAPQGAGTGGQKEEEKVNLTMTGQNLLKITNILNNTIKRISERSREGAKPNEAEASGNAKKMVSEKKNKTVN